MSLKISSFESEVLVRPLSIKNKKQYSNPFDSTDTIKVCSYRFIVRAEIQLTSWDLVVIDDSYLRNVYRPGNVIAREIARAIRDYKKILLTASPLQNRLDELWFSVMVDQKCLGTPSFGENMLWRNGYH